MKIFEFDPKRGVHGKEIGWRPAATWAGQSVSYCVENGLIEPIEFKTPSYGGDFRWSVHVDAGSSSDSYLDDKWICFCTGYVFNDDVWEWVVLPPKQLIVWKEGVKS